MYYAIRQKSTGFFLSGEGRKRGYTYEEPVNSNVRSPRLFTKSYSIYLCIPSSG